MFLKGKERYVRIKIQYLHIIPRKRNIWVGSRKDGQIDEKVGCLKRERLQGEERRGQSRMEGKAILPSQLNLVSNKTVIY